MDEKQQAIFEIQTFLRNISKINKDIPSVVPDGIYDDKTRKSVTEFQKFNSLDATGKVDFATWKMLSEENDAALFILSSPIQVAPIKNSDLPLKRGDIKDTIYTLKLMLKKLADEFNNFIAPELNNLFDEQTENQIRNWQKIIRIPQTGEVDKMTWNMLSKYYKS